MTHKVIFHSDRLAAYYWSDGDYAEVPFTISSLRLPVFIDEGVTLGQIFQSVLQHPPLKNFIAQYSWCASIDEFHFDAHTKPRGIEDEVTGLVISAHGEVFSGEFNISMDFHGVGGDTRWTVSLSPMNEIAWLPVEIDAKFTVSSMDSTVNHEWEYRPTLLQALDAIYWDISFHGSPSENKEFGEMLARQVARRTRPTVKCRPPT